MTQSMPDSVFAGLISNRAATSPDLDVVTFEGAQVRRDETRTYRTLWQNGLRLARALRDRGMQPGDHFALLMANHPEFLDAMVAASISGTVFVPIDPRAKGDKLSFMLENAACKGVVAADYALETLLAVRGACQNLAWVIGLATDEAPRVLSDYPGIVPYESATQ